MKKTINKTVKAVKKSVKEVKKVNKVTEVSVFNNNGEFVRTYSEEKHGKDFAKLAEQFSNKNGYSA